MRELNALGSRIYFCFILKMMHNMLMLKRIFILASFGLVLIVGVLMYFQLRAKTSSPVTTELPQELTYTNDLFSINYPSTVKVVETPMQQYNNKGVVITFYYSNNSSDSCGNTHLAINIDNGGFCGSPVYPGSTSEVKGTTVKLFNMEVQRFDKYKSGMTQPFLVGILDFIYKGRNVSINYYISMSDYGNITEITKTFEHMLSTLR